MSNVSNNLFLPPPSIGSKRRLDSLYNSNISAQSEPPNKIVRMLFQPESPARTSDQENLPPFFNEPPQIPSSFLSRSRPSQMKVAALKKTVPIREGANGCKVYEFSGIEYPISDTKNGKFHRVCFFEKVPEDVFITMNGKNLRLKNCVIRYPHQLQMRRGGNEATKILTDDLKALKLLRENHISHALVHVTHEEYQDPHNSSYGNCWIIERCPYEVTTNSWSEGQTFNSLSTKDREILEFVIKIFKLNLVHGKNIVPDVRPANVFLNDAKEPCIIDFGIPQEEEDLIEFFENFHHDLHTWIQNNPSIEAFFMQELSGCAEDHFNEYIAYVNSKRAIDKEPKNVVLLSDISSEEEKEERKAMPDSPPIYIWD